MTKARTKRAGNSTKLPPENRLPDDVIKFLEGDLRKYVESEKPTRLQLARAIEKLAVLAGTSLPRNLRERIRAVNLACGMVASRARLPASTKADIALAQSLIHDISQGKATQQKLDALLKVAKTLRKRGIPTHSKDFTSVVWYGTRYSFTKGNQANSIRVLWEAWKTGEHSLAQETIGSMIGSTND